MYSASEMRNCERCGVPFKVYMAHVRRGGVRKFCSQECTWLDRADRPSRLTLITMTCVECGKEFSRRKGSEGKGLFCSIGCMAIWRGRSLSGQNHPLWAGGGRSRSFASRKAIRMRIAESGFCEECGSKDDLQGHHMKAASEFPELASDGNNIQVLCMSCHATKHPDLAAFIMSKNGEDSGKIMD